VKLIQTDNKNLIRFNVLTTSDNVDFFEKFNTSDLGFEYNVIPFKGGFNYTDKLNYVLNLDGEYSIKMDEDCIINNHIWDYMITNTSVLDNTDNLLLSPMLSTSQPSCDEFIKGFLSERDRDIIYNHFLNQKMPNGLFGVNYESLNEFTVNSTEWNEDDYYIGLDKIPTNTKGMHPIRISYNAQTTLNDMIIKNVSKLTTKGSYGVIELDRSYFTINMFMMKTSLWREIFNKFGGTYDEISISQHKKITNTKFLFVENGYGIHTMYNTIYGNQNKWGIGGVDSAQKEIEFINDLKDIIL
tara:strand:+ start:1572 stop:2468 length:897 start_codon:yes stop_codon:yes gene_type:complete